jgi:tRNA(adenine34) deaminase
MQQALLAAARAADMGEVPVGAILVIQDRMITSAHNERECRRDPTAHAEILALQAASRQLGRWRLTDACLYVTLEPCPMCAGALVNSRIGRLVYGATDPKAGAAESLYTLLQDPRLNHSVELTAGVCAKESATLLKTFFAARRKKKSGE